MKRIATAIVLLAVASLVLYAQSARWQLVSAEYGAGNTWVDVTSRVASMVRDNSINIRVDDETLGVDPAHGTPKTLRLHVRDDDGRDSLLSYSEKDTVSLSISTAASAGLGRDADHRDRRRGGRGFGDGLKILHADYGTQNRFADVTARLNSQIQNDNLNLRITNDTMGGDPADDRRKILTVWYAYNGRAANVVVNEKDTLALPGPNDYVSGNLRILRAQYGADYRYFDVTDRLNSQLQNDQLSLRITNDIMGGDPAPDRAKQLSVVFIFNGDQCRATVNEKDTLDLPGAGDCTGDFSAGGFQILHATYGAGDRIRDVTDRIGAMVNGDQVQFAVSNSALGGDPAGGQRKQLRVIYLWQGIRYEAITPEKGILSIP